MPDANAMNVLLSAGAPAPDAGGDPSFTLRRVDTATDLAAALEADEFDAAVIVAQQPGDPAWRAALAVADGPAIVLVVPHAPADAVAAALRGGVQEVVDEADATPRRVAAAVMQAAIRQQLATAQRVAHGTDVATGLPNAAQLVAHLSQLLALRGREPAPMALLALRLHGLDASGERRGEVEAGILRRKVAVRVRSALRASDVVAAVDDTTLAVLLASIEEDGDAARVADKLARVLARPFTVAGGDAAVAVGIGVVPFAGDTAPAQELLAQAQRAAAKAGPNGRAGLAPGMADPAANDG